MPVIGPDLRAEPGQMAFVSWTKDPFSTIANDIVVMVYTRFSGHFSYF
jgi:hypothetical protein